MTSKTTKKSKANPIDGRILRLAQSTGWAAILESIIIAILGLLLVIDPSWVTQLIFYVVGIFLIIKGVYKIINYFAVHGKYDFYNNDLLYGIIALIFGIIAVVLWEELRGVISIIVGAWVIYGALVRLNTAIKMHSAGVKTWGYALALSLVMLVLGIFMIVNLNAIPALVGWIMLISAVISIVDDAILLRNLRAVTQ